jgi:hypothetical protein
MDAFYTPGNLARLMVESADIKSGLTCVADFAAGDGALLRAAEREWPSAIMVATDMDRSKVQKLCKAHPGWLSGRCNFLDVQSRCRCAVLLRFKKKIRLVLLNPPFSCRGAARWSVVFHEERVGCSRAMAFVLEALDYLCAEGTVVAVLPCGSLRSEKDSRAWSLVRRFCRVKIVRNNGHRVFNGCVPRTVLVRLELRRRAVKQLETVEGRRSAIGRKKRVCVGIARGSMPVHRTSNCRDGRGVRFIHTTELKDNRIVRTKRRVVHLGTLVKGPAVLLPRVGLPSKMKVAILHSQRGVVLSDCIIALTCSDVNGARQVQQVLISKWDAVAREYSGTCAPYLTLGRLASVLAALGFHTSGL